MSNTGMAAAVSEDRQSTGTAAAHPIKFPDNGKRAIIFMLFDSRGEVARYVEHLLKGLRDHADLICVVFNGELNERARQVLGGLADTVFERENVGFDVWAYREALIRIGEDRLAEFDEILLMNYTCYGPVGSFDDTFASMNSRATDFWGVTDHASVDPHPFLKDGQIMERHIQSQWIAVRRRMFLSDAWRSYWQSMPMITSYRDSILRHESRFTAHFIAEGFTDDVLFPVGSFNSKHPAVDEPLELIRRGCPLVKRRLFFHDPLYFDLRGVVSRWVLDEIDQLGFPIDLILEDMTRTATPRVLNTNGSMLSIFPDVRESLGEIWAPRLAVVVVLSGAELQMETLSILENLPPGYDLFLDTPLLNWSSTLDQAVIADGSLGAKHVMIRVRTDSDAGARAGFWQRYCEIFTSTDYDIVMRIEVGFAAQEDSPSARIRQREELENLLNSRGYVQNILDLFSARTDLGIVFPVRTHAGQIARNDLLPENIDEAKALAESLDIRVPFDETSPIVPVGSMFVARPSALTGLVKDFSDSSEPANAREMLLPYAVGELGYTIRTVSTCQNAATSHELLEYKVDQIFASDKVRRVYSTQVVEEMTKAKATRKELAGAYADPVAFAQEALNVTHALVGKVFSLASKVVQRGRVGP